MGLLSNEPALRASTEILPFWRSPGTIPSRQRGWVLTLPAHYSIDGVCAACRGAIRSGDDRYRIGDREYHAHCFDISLWFPVVRIEAME